MPRLLVASILVAWSVLGPSKAEACDCSPIVEEARVSVDPDAADRPSTPRVEGLRIVQDSPGCNECTCIPELSIRLSVVDANGNPFPDSTSFLVMFDGPSAERLYWTDGPGRVPFGPAGDLIVPVADPDAGIEAEITIAAVDASAAVSEPVAIDVSESRGCGVSYRHRGPLPGASAASRLSRNRACA